LRSLQAFYIFVNRNMSVKSDWLCIFLYYSDDECVPGSYMYGGILCLSGYIAFPYTLTPVFASLVQILFVSTVLIDTFHNCMSCV